MSHRTLVVGIVVALAIVAIVAYRDQGSGGDLRAHAGGVPWERSLSDALEKATGERKLVMVDFYTDWCGWCRKLDETTLADPHVHRALDKFVAVRLNAEKDGREAAVRYRVDGYPTVLFLDAGGVEVGRIPGYLPPGPFLEEMQDIVGKS
jgi:thiol:disulfide interchange protein